MAIRIRPIRQDIQEAQSCKELKELLEEVCNLIKSSISADKRALRANGGQGKRELLAKQNLYCSLYREIYNKYYIVKKQTKDLSAKDLLTLEDFLIKFNWEKKIKYSSSYQNLNNMKFFNRNDKQVKADALSLSLQAFVAKYDGTTAPETLRKAYKELGGTQFESTEELDSKIDTRVGVEEENEPLSEINPLGEEATPALSDEEVEEMNQLEHQFPANVEGSEEFNSANELTEGEKEMLQETDSSHLPLEDPAAEGPVNGNSTDEANFDADKKEIHFGDLSAKEKQAVVVAKKDNYATVSLLKKALEGEGYVFKDYRQLYATAKAFYKEEIK